jgi:LruC domain-containing protein
MDKVVRWSICILGMLMLSACPMERVLTGSSPITAPPLPPDLVADVPRSATDSFEFETLLPVDVNLTVRQYEYVAGTKESGEWMSRDPRTADVYITVTDSQGEAVYAGRVLPDGTLSSRLMLPAAPEDLTFTLSAEGYVERSFTVPAASARAEINRTVSMQADPAGIRSVVLPDRDGDSVPDVYDAFPDDPESAFAINVPFDGPLTIAFEDLFGLAQAGDADYNDFIASYRITEYANGQENAIVRVDVTATAVAKIAGYNHDFSIAIDSFTGCADLTIAYPAKTNTSAKTCTARVKSPAIIPLFISTKDSVGQEVSFSLHFDKPQPRATMDQPPYNPFLHVRNTWYDIHLIGEEAMPGSRSAGRSFQDAEGFPWALLVPSAWEHPLEGQRIEVPYPRFTLWRQSFGAEHTDWYLHNDDPYVPTLNAYVAGTFESGTRDVAALWKDDVANADPAVVTKLFETANAYSSSVVVSGTDVYVAGYYTNAAYDKNDAACYWKNGVRTDLYSDLTGTTDARALSVFVSGADVYVAGYINDGREKAGYWKNGKWELLHDATISEATDIAVNGSDVYVSGFVETGFRDTACYWENGTRKDLSTSDYSRGYSIAVSGSDIYVAGYYLLALDLKAGYWKNGILVPLAAGGAQARDIVASGTDVYVAGYYRNASLKEAACYWKNGIVVNLYNDTVNQGRAYAICVDGSDVYVAGYVDEGVQAACYWKNGARTVLSTSTSAAFSIAVAE